MKNIWFINMAGGSPYHGMVFRTYYLALEMVRAGHEVTIFSGSFCHNYFNPPKISGVYTEEWIDGIRYIWVKIPVYPQSKSLMRVLAMFIFAWRTLVFKTKQLRKPLAIIVSSPSPISIIPGYFFSKKFSAKLFFEVRDIWPLSLQLLGNIPWYHPFILLMSFLEKFAYRHANYVATVLPKAKTHFMSRGMEEEKFFYAPNGINCDLPSKEVPSQALQIQSIKESSKFIVGYAGTFGIANNLDLLIDVANLLRNDSDFHFVLLGEGALEKSLKDKVQQLQLTNVTFLNPVSKKEVSHCIRKFNVGYISLKKEPVFRFGVSPNKIFDYMLEKIPVLMSIDAGNDLVKEANCGISVPSCTIQDIMQGLVKLKSLSEAERMELGLNGFHFVNNHHQYQNIAQRYLDKIT